MPIKTAKLKLTPSVDLGFSNSGLAWQKYLGRGRDDNDLVANGIYHRVFQKTEHTIIYVNGFFQSRYIYPLIERRFSSVMVNDYNLCFVGGWWPNDQHGICINTYTGHLDRVISGQKPMAWLSAFKGRPSVQELRDLELKARSFGLATSFTETDDRLSLAVCRKGKLAELFDLKALRADYINFLANTSQVGYYRLVTKEVINTIDSLNGTTLEQYINWNTEPEGSTRYYILTGLLLGFPIESTISIL